VQVRDYVVGRHTAKELKGAHRILVEYFRVARPKDPYGRPQWDSTLAKQDKVTGYIIEHAGYHIAQGWDEDMESDELAIGGWLGDTPQDSIVLAAGRVLGVPKLIARAEQAEAGTEWWLAARLHNVARNLLSGSEGSGASVPSLLKCLDALVNVEPGHERDDMELELLYELLMALNIPELMARGTQIFQILQTDAKARNPIAAAMMSQMAFMEKMMGGDKPTLEAVAVNLTRALVVDGAQNPDPNTRVKCLLVGLNFASFMCERLVRLRYHPTLSLWDLLGAEKWIEGTEVYDFALHPYLVSKTITDAAIQYPGYLNWLLMRTGHVTKAFEWMERALGYQRRALAEATAEMANMDSLARAAVGDWAIICGTLRLPTEQRATAAAMLEDHGISWSTAGDIVDEMVAIRAGTIRPRGDSTTIDPTFRTTEDATQLYWQLKVCEQDPYPS
jgi:hypothetical protein